MRAGAPYALEFHGDGGWSTRTLEHHQVMYAVWHSKADGPREGRYQRGLLLGSKGHCGEGGTGRKEGARVHRQRQGIVDTALDQVDWRPPVKEDRELWRSKVQGRYTLGTLTWGTGSAAGLANLAASTLGVVFVQHQNWEVVLLRCTQLFHELFALLPGVRLVV